MRFPTMWYVRPTEPQISLRIQTEHHLEFLSLKGGCRGSPESKLVKILNCWKSHGAAQNFSSYSNYADTVAFAHSLLFRKF